MQRLSGRGDDASHIIYAAKVRAVEEIESFHHELQRALLSHFHLPAQARIKADVIGTNAGVASNPRRTVRSRVAVIIDVRSGQL